MFGLGKDKTFTVHMVVKNEDRWVWYAISSVIDLASKILIYDTGSIDKTIEIIKTFNSDKIEFKEVGNVDKYKLTDLRQQQVSETKTDWFMILDGDEVWSKKELLTTWEVIKEQGKEKMGVVVKTGMCIGDIYHFQDEKAGKYKIGDRRGHYNIRFYKKKYGYHWMYPYPDEAYVDSSGIPLQNKTDQLLFSDSVYWHARHLPRSTKSKNPKLKLELGSKVDDNLIPEVFFFKTPEIVPPLFVGLSKIQYLEALLLTPLYKINRMIS